MSTSCTNDYLRLAEAVLLEQHRQRRPAPSRLVMGRHRLPAGCCAPIFMQARCRSRRRFRFHSEAAWDAERWRRAS